MCVCVCVCVCDLYDNSSVMPGKHQVVCLKIDRTKSFLE